MAYLKGSAWLVCCLLVAELSALTPSCVRDIELHFFQQNLVQEAFSLHGISQSNWNLINYELARRVKRVPDIVEKKARRMDPNPFGPPYRPFDVQDIVEATLLEVFKETLSLFQIQNEGQIVEMFNYIRNKQEHKFVNCFGEKVSQK